MNTDHNSLGSEQERTAQINRTIDELQRIKELDIPNIVVRAMDAYSKKRIEEIDQQSLSKRTAKELRQVAERLEAFSNVVADIFSVIGPAAVTWLIVLFWLLTEHINIAVVLLASFLPVGIGVFLFVLSTKWEFPLSILQDSRFSFIAPNSMGPLVGGFLMAGVIGGILTYTGFQRQVERHEAQLISVTSAKSLLVARSIRTMRDLQDPTRIEEISTKPGAIPLSPDKVLVIKTERQVETRTVKHRIEDGDIFPGELEATLGPKSGSLNWIQNGKPVQQTQFYVCKVNNTTAGNIVVEPVESNGAVSNQVKPKPLDLDSPTMELLLNGNYIPLTLDYALVDTGDLTKGQNIILVFDPVTHTALQIEELSATK